MTKLQKTYFNLRPDQVIELKKERKRLKVGVYELGRKVVDEGLKAVRKLT
jgi:hypothetical protein